MFNNNSNSLWDIHILPHLFATNQDFPRIRQDKTTDAFKKNCLAASVPSDDSIYFSGCDRKAHMVQNRLFPEPFYDILYFYQIFHSLNPLCLHQIIYKPDSIASSVYVFDFFIMINPVTRIIAISTARIYHSGTASSLLK